MAANIWVSTSTTRNLKRLDSELVDRKVQALLNKLTMEKFESISDQIIYWANRSVNETDGRTLLQVIRLTLEHATDVNEPAWSEMYARLCRKMMEQVSPEVQDDGVKNSNGKPIAGGLLFRKYLLNRCQGDFERGWVAKGATAAAAAEASDYQATKAANKKGTLDAEFNFDEYYAAQKAKRQGLGLIKFIGELFKLQMLTERIMHECVKKFLGNVENLQEEEIESLCQLLKTVGQLLDTPQARAHMDVYFTRMKELGKSLNVSSRMQFMLQDVIELRGRGWVTRNAIAAPTTIAAVHEQAAKEKEAREKESFYRQRSMFRGGSRRGGDRNQEHGPDGWAVAGGTVPRAPPKAGDLSQFGKVNKGAPMALVMGPSGVFAAGMRDSKALSRTNSSSDMFYMLRQNPELAPETSIKPGRVLEPDAQHRKLQFLPRSMLSAEENTTAYSEEEHGTAPTAMSEADIKKKIDGHVKEFFTLRNLEEADVYFTHLPHEFCFRLVDHRQTRMSRGGSRDQEYVPDGRAVAGGSVLRAPPKAGDLSQFGKISMGVPMVTSSVFAGGKKDRKREILSRTNSSSNMFHMLSQNPELAPETSTKFGHSSSRKLRFDLGHPGVPEPAAQRRKLQLLLRSVLAADENTMTSPEEELETAPITMSEADAKKKIDEDVKEFFAVRNLEEADVYFTNLPDEHRFRLVDKLVTSALESKETDAKLVGDFFAQAMTNGQCTLEVFEEGFMPMAEFLDDIAIDAPKAFDYMAIMLRGAGFKKDPERLQRIASRLEDSDKLVSLVA